MRKFWFVVCAAHAALTCCFADDKVDLKGGLKSGFSFAPQAVSGISFEITDLGDFEMVAEGMNRHRLVAGVGLGVEPSRVKWDEDIFAPCRFSVSIGRHRFATQECIHEDSKVVPTWSELTELEDGETVLASRFTEASPRRHIQVTSHGKVLTTEFFEDVIRETSTLRFPSAGGEFRQAEIQIPDEAGAMAALALGHGSGLQSLGVINRDSELLGFVRLPEVLELGYWDAEWSEVGQRISVSSPTGSWQASFRSGGITSWTGSIGIKAFSEKRTNSACTYDYRLRDHRRNAWDNFLDFSAATHVFERMIKATNGTGRRCSPTMKIPATAASFVRVEASRSGAVIGDWNVVFRVSFYNGSTYRQRVLTLDQPRLGYDGLLVGLSQNGNRTNSCAAFPLTEGLRRPMAQEFDPRFHRIVKIFIDYRNPGCSQQGDFAVIACGRDVGAGGMVAKRASVPFATSGVGFPWGSGSGLDFFASAWNAVSARESSSTTTCVIEYDMHTGN